MKGAAAQAKADIASDNKFATAAKKFETAARAEESAAATFQGAAAEATADARLILRHDEKPTTVTALENAA